LDGVMWDVTVAWMITFISPRAAAAVSLLQLPALRKCRISGLITAPVRYAAHRAAMPGAHHPRNRDIPHHTVQVVREEGGLGPPTPLSDVLQSIDSKSQYVQLVSEDPQPLVKILNKLEQYNKLKEWQKRQKGVAASNVRKEIQMTWGVESSDFTHKVNKARKELERGSRVELVFAPKANQPVPSRAMMEARINQTMENLADIAKEWLPRKVERGVAILYLKKLDGSS